MSYGQPNVLVPEVELKCRLPWTYMTFTNNDSRHIYLLRDLNRYLFGILSISTDHFTDTVKLSPFGEKSAFCE